MGLLRDANVHLLFGLESSSPEVLRAVGKIGRPDGPTDGCERERRFLGRIREKVELAHRVG